MAPFPKKIQPMLCTPVKTVPSGEDWVFEVKWDGYRSLAFCEGKTVNLVSRNNKNFNDKYYPLHQAFKDLKLNAIIDGEIAVLNDQGVPSFGALQNWRSEADGELVYFAFDILWHKGKDLMHLPLLERREILKKVLPFTDIIKESELFNGDPKVLLEEAKALGLEGIIAKKGDSSYIPGERGLSWLKIKALKRHEVVIGGFTRNEHSPKIFSALLVGVYENNDLKYTGKIGTGFNDKQQKEMMAQFSPLITNKCPFSFEPDVNSPSRFRPNPPHAQATWLKPKLVCEVSYTELTSDGIMRHPSFQGMRMDKKVSEVHLEKTVEIKPSKKTKERKTLLNPKEETQVKKIEGHEIKFTNLSKVFWPEEGYTKRELINYYYQVAPYIVPYLKNRPQSLNRFPNGIKGKSFYQKDVTASAPDWIEQYPYTTGLGEHKNFLVVQGEADVLWMANMAAIEMNPWNSTIKKPDHPDWCSIDLDPTEQNPFEQVIETARATKKILDMLKIEGFCKTSGGDGIHIYIPLKAKYTYDECQLLGRKIAALVHQEVPKFTSVERYTDKRKGKIYIDFLQNRAKATLAAPYSVRPKPGATVSMPLHWDEVKKGLTPKKFTIANAIERIKREGDLFKPVLGKGIDLKKALKELE